MPKWHAKHYPELWVATGDNERQKLIQFTLNIFTIKNFPFTRPTFSPAMAYLTTTLPLFSDPLWFSLCEDHCIRCLSALLEPLYIMHCHFVTNIIASLKTSEEIKLIFVLCWFYIVLKMFRSADWCGLPAQAFSEGHTGLRRCWPWGWRHCRMSNGQFVVLWMTTSIQPPLTSLLPAPGCSYYSWTYFLRCSVCVTQVLFVASQIHARKIFDCLD